MADGPTKSPVRLGPFQGLDERAGGDRTLVSAALNVDFGPEGIRRRPGRQIIGSIGSVPVTALFRHVFKSGSDTVLAVGDPSDSQLLGAFTFGTLDDYAFTAVALPAGQDKGGGLDQPFIQAPFNGHSIIANAGGTLLDFDGQAVTVLGALQGKDAASGLQGAKTYLAAPPLARAATIWRNRLVVCDGVTIGISADDGSPRIPTNAPVGGPNVWPSNTWFDVLTDNADRTRALGVLQDRLAVLGTTTAHIVDEDELSPIARLQDHEHGILAPRSLQIVGSTAFYLSYGKVVAFDGVNVVEISEQISETLKLVNWRAAAGAVSAHLRRKKEYRLWLPLAGEQTNSICVIFSYKTKRWRIYAGWYPFATQTERASHQPFDVRSALSMLLSSGEEILLTGDGSGNVWREDVTEHDGTSCFPAYVTLPMLGAGSNRISFGDVRAECLWDGSRIQAYLLNEGEEVEHAIQRAPDVNARALRTEQVTFGSVAAWGFKPYTPRYDILRLPLAAKSHESRIVLLMPGVEYGLSAVETAPGGIRWVEATVDGLPSRSP